MTGEHTPKTIFNEGLHSFCGYAGEIFLINLNKFLQSRVTGCIEKVEDILDLKYCTDGVQQALQNEDYEKVVSVKTIEQFV